MNFSYNWIAEFVEGLHTAPGELERLITMKTAECEGIEPAGALFAESCAARVESVEPIPDSKNLKAVVDAGRYGRKTVVCGAPNCRPGLLTAYVPTTKKTIQGIESDGMLASADELGINRDHSGILELETQIGAPLAGCGPDTIIEIDNKSLTHRPDLWGHYGMAREVAAITSARLVDPVRPSLIPAGAPAIRVEIEDLNLCPRYSALVFENVTVRPSPLWLQYRLTAIGLNPINNIVDLTNYIMAELAQPMHAFDRALLKGDTIFARPARAGEKLVALNDEEYELTPANLVIADEGGPIALAGVIGGRESAISDSTKTIVLESANFQASSIRKTSSALKIRTDASMRFEKAQDPANTVRALARAIELLPELSPGIRLAGGLSDRKKDIPEPPPPIRLNIDWLARKLGRIIEAQEVRNILERLQFGVTESEPGALLVTVPSWRATKDIAVADDLVEEVGRMIGYDSIEPRPPAVPSAVPPDSEERLFLRDVRRMLAAQGFTEVHNYSFLSEEQARQFGFDPASHVRVLNPIAADQSLMRSSLLPGVYRNIVENAKHFTDFRLFEVGREIHKRPGGLPDEATHLLAAIYSKGDGAAALLELKRVAECVALNPTARPAEAFAYEHPARSANVVLDGDVVGRIFELHPSLVESGRAAVLDLDLRKIPPHGRVQYRPIRRYPSSAFDLSVIVQERELVGDLQAKLRAFAGPMLEAIEYQRQYTGDPLPRGTKSVSFRLTLGAAGHTLSAEEVTAVRAAAIDGMRQLGYELRV
ncbi:MAG: phenylalanine--tRNA ligase subunit beta [Acidobacteriota bacterium]|nr:phenylalanine--tRNA ligase subunit beta [Acidobacteriota bacterium]